MDVGSGRQRQERKSDGKSNGKRREASLRQSGSAFGAAVIGRAEALPFRFAISLCIAIEISLCRAVRQSWVLAEDGCRQRQTTSDGKSNGKNNGKSNGKRREARLWQSGSAFGAAILGRAEEAAEKVDLWRRSVPQRLKPYCKYGACGTGKPVPLSKTGFFSTL